MAFYSQLGPHPFYLLIQVEEDEPTPAPAIVAWCVEHADSVKVVPAADGGCMHKLLAAMKGWQPCPS